METISASNSSLSPNGVNALNRVENSISFSCSRLSALDDLLKEVHQEFSLGRMTLSSRIEGCFSSLRKELFGIREDLRMLKTDLTSGLNELSVSVSSVKHDAFVNKEANERLEKANDLLLTGVPFSTDEDLHEGYRKVAAHLGYNDGCLPIVHTRRLSNRRLTVGSTSPVLYQFALKSARDDFFLRYLSKLDLTLLNLGFDSSKRVYLNENLTYQALQVRRSATFLRSAGKLTQVKVKNGIVFVQRDTDQRLIPVYSTSQLDVHAK